MKIYDLYIYYLLISHTFVLFDNNFSKKINYKGYRTYWVSFIYK